MAIVNLNGIDVMNVEPCPACGSEQYAHIAEVPYMHRVCCNDCEYEAPGSVVFRGRASMRENPKTFIELTRVLFNHWNLKIAEANDTKPKRVRIRRKEKKA